MTKDANKKKYEEELDAVNQEISEELRNWDELGVQPPQSINLDPFILDNTMFALIEHLIEEGVMKKDKWMVFRQKRLLGKLVDAREKITPYVREAKLKGAGVEIPQILMPPGFLGNDKDTKH